ncbi:MAG: hypothetical protein ABI151_11000 [Chitinophagaceae bacterium]
MIRISLLLASTLICFSCKNNTGKKEEQTETAFFPLASILNEQWKNIDSLHLSVMKISTNEGVNDTVTSSLPELKKAAEGLINPDITQPPLNGKYRETSFADQTIPSITLTYASEDKSLAVQRLDILLQPDPVDNDKLRTIYMEKNETLGNIFVSKKILLMANRSLQVITSSKDSTLNIVKFSWDGIK